MHGEARYPDGQVTWVLTVAGGLAFRLQHASMCAVRKSCCLQAVRLL